MRAAKSGSGARLTRLFSKLLQPNPQQTTVQSVHYSLTPGPVLSLDGAGRTCVMPPLKLEGGKKGKSSSSSSITQGERVRRRRRKKKERRRRQEDPTRIEGYDVVERREGEFRQQSGTTCFMSRRSRQSSPCAIFPTFIFFFPPLFVLFYQRRHLFLL